MATTLTIRDETSSGQSLHSWALEVLTERITVRELIRSRVYQEVQDYNTRQPEYFRGLIQPTDAEKTLNGYKLRQARRIDWKPQYEKAIDAFSRNGFLLLINNRQAEDLDEEITLAPDTTVSFLKLVPLVGG